VGFYLAGWTTFLGESSETNGRGRYLAAFASIGSLGALVGLLIATAASSFSASYVPLYLIAGASFVVSSAFLARAGEPDVVRAQMPSGGRTRIRRYYYVTAVYGFFWGFAWPLFTITTVKIVGMSLPEYALSQVIAVACTIGFQPVVGRMVDRDRKMSVFLGRFGLIAYPLGYMVFTQAWQIYAIKVYSGFTNALLNVAFSAYLFDLAPTGSRGRCGAEFNLVNGVSTMAGSLTASSLLTTLTPGNSLWISLAYLYIVAAVGRAFAAVLHLIL